MPGVVYLPRKIFAMLPFFVSHKGRAEEPRVAERMVGWDFQFHTSFSVTKDGGIFVFRICKGQVVDVYFDKEDCVLLSPNMAEKESRGIGSKAGWVSDHWRHIPIVE